MHKVRRNVTGALLLAGAITLFAGCSEQTAATSSETSKTPPTSSASKSSGYSSEPAASKNPAKNETVNANNKAVQVVANPDNIAVLVNKQWMLPDGYKPSDLVEPNVPFIFKEKLEKRLMRKEAAQALEKLFAGAKKDGIHLSGVSGYRSYKTQTALFNRYIKTHGEEAARKFSAAPGHSEHETGLAIDVSGSTGKCAAEDCFANTPEAKWLAKHAPEYGFIIRYPKGKEAITGYKYEPWHIRYVGINIAKEIASKNITLEEYVQHMILVSK
ncbi:M15 family metallopeptidase [Aneurinibacillus thermoaerophilus]|nr:M15 family metallopeptidase [Aneurinibacillus thermoaerophilus]